MKYLILFTAFLAVIASSSAQENPDCGWYGNKTVAERNAMFPFNKAKKVVLISYPYLLGMDPVEEDTINALPEYNTIKEVRFRIGKQKRETIYFVKEEVVLAQDWINMLSHVLVNYTLKELPKNGYIIEHTMCYSPRNSILFYDENDTIICCYEICFECSNTAMWPDTNGLNEYADASDCKYARLDELKFIFRKNGITYGLDEK